MGVVEVTFSPIPERAGKLVWGRAIIWRVPGIEVKLQSPGIPAHNKVGNLPPAVSYRNRDSESLGLIWRILPY
jgi:hypothetical protein